MDSPGDGFDVRGLGGHISETAFSPATLPHGVHKRLTHDRYAWFTTVASTGVPAPMLVWFHFDRELVVYSQPRSRLVTNVFEHPEVSLHLESDGLGSSVVVVGGTARVTAEGVDPRADKQFWAKYHVEADAVGLTKAVASLSARITISPTTLWTTLPS